MNEKRKSFIEEIDDDDDDDEFHVDISNTSSYINTNEVELYDPSGSDIYGTGQYSLSKEHAIELARKILNTYDVKL